MSGLGRQLSRVHFQSSDKVTEGAAAVLTARTGITDATSAAVGSAAETSSAAPTPLSPRRYR
jgi:hypothetical protein